MNVTIKTDGGGLAEHLRKAPPAALEGMREGIRDLAIDAERALIHALPHRSGAARQSIGHELRSMGLIPSVVVGAIIAPPPYMGILEHGGTIKPKNAKHLTIPLSAAKTGSGTRTRFTARQVISSPEAFGYEGTFLHRGSMIIFGKLKAAIAPLFKLVDQVIQKATNGGRGWLRAPIEDLLARGAHRDRIGAAVRRKLAEAGLGGVA